MVAPPRSTRAISSARRAKSAERIDGTISIICGLLRFYHSGEEAVPGVAARQAPHASGRRRRRRHGGHHVLVLLPFERTGGVDQQAAGRQRRARACASSAACRACSPARSSGFSRHLISGLRASVPVPEQGASSRMRSKRPAEGQRSRAVEHHQRRSPAASACAGARQVEVAGDGPHAGFERLGGLVARRGAEVQKASGPGARLQQRHDGLRADVLDAESARRRRPATR